MDGLGNHGIPEHLGLRVENGEEYFQMEQQQHQHFQDAHNHPHGLADDIYFPPHHDDTCLGLSPGHIHTHGSIKSHQLTVYQAPHGRSMSMAAAISIDRAAFSAPHTPDTSPYNPYYNPNFTTMMLPQSDTPYEMPVDWLVGYQEQQQQQQYQEEQHQQSSPAMPSNRYDCDDSCAIQCPDSRCEQGDACKVACNDENCAGSPCLSGTSPCDDSDCEEGLCSDQDCFVLDEHGMQAAQSLVSLPIRAAESESQPPTQRFSDQATVHGLPPHVATQSVNMDQLAGLPMPPDFPTTHANFGASSAGYGIPSDGFQISPSYISQGYTDVSEMDLETLICIALEHQASGHHDDRCPGTCFDTINSFTPKNCPLPMDSHFHPGQRGFCPDTPKQGECGADLPVHPGAFLEHVREAHPMNLDTHMADLQQPVWPSSQDSPTFPTQTVADNRSLSRDSSRNMSSPTLSPASRSLTVTPVTTDSDNGQSCLCKWVQDGQICGLRLPSDDALQKHCKEDHLGMMAKEPKGFPCLWSTCPHGTRFNQKSKLERHMQTHTGYKPVSCSICGAALSAKQSLAQHMRIHTGDKPWKCDWENCKQSFKQQSALTMHRRTHTGEKPLACEICGKKFGESSNLSKHRKTHNVKGQFACDICGKDFHRLDQMRRHMKVHNKDKDEQHGNGNLGRVVGGRVEKNTK
ncbi:hypothetical protein CcaCcLH18_05326 [Colletotrichum camelliae]|nr:hypothetical protein CcaCcLH18_05326 [Colletotrichum camelliae]